LITQKGERGRKRFDKKSYCGRGRKCSRRREPGGPAERDTDLFVGMSAEMGRLPKKKGRGKRKAGNKRAHWIEKATTKRTSFLREEENDQS